MANNKTHDNGALWGIILIALGLIFLIQKLFNIEILSQIWQFWPLLLIIWGIVVLRDHYEKRS